ncbi:MAG: carbamoyl phosphate synthase large subunit, partial [Paludibacteraceae bacterium]|nr:carbamoyl phosphate synthase large subunit [Paludibacteraceae bacterium]
VGTTIPEKNIMVSSGDAKSKVDLLEPCRELSKNGYNIYATVGTQKFLAENGINATVVGWPDDEDSELKITDMMAGKKFDLVINIPKNQTRRELTNGYKIRRAAIDHNIPLLTNARLASAFIHAFCTVKETEIPIKAWDEYKA